MKKLYTVLSAILLTASVFAQAPEKMSYQAVIRDVSNTLVTNKVVSMQLSILQGSISGTPVYIETQTPSTNINGLVSIEIGLGTVISGTFNTIDWSTGPYFIKTETDPTGAMNYTITGTSQLMSVPYALHAKTAESISGTINYTETDPTFGASIANGITAADTSNWNNHTTQLDEAAVDAFVANNGYLTTEVDGSITNEIELPTGGTNGQVLKTDGTGNYDWVNQTTNTNTQLDETAVDAFVANNGYLTTEVDGSITNEIELPAGGTNGQVLKTDGTGNYDWVNQTTNTNTQLDETAVDAFVANNGYLTTEVDGSITNEIELPAGGTNGQVLKTDGTGNYAWVNQTTSATGSETKVTAGTNITVTGSGTVGSPYIVNAGGSAPEYIFLSPDGVSGGYISFGTAVEVNGIAFNSSTNEFTLKAGKTYMLDGAIYMHTTSSTNTYSFVFYNKTNNANIGSEAYQRTSDYSGAIINQPSMAGIITPSTDIQVGVKDIYGATGGVIQTRCFFRIIELK